MRVLVLTPWYPAAEGDPTGSFVRDHALAAARHHDVALLHLTARGEREGREEYRDGPLRVLRVTPPPTRRRGSLAVSSLAAMVPVLRHLARDGFHPDLLHAHVFSAGFVAVLSGRALRRPVVVSEHYSGFGRGQVNGVAAAVARVAFAGADLVCPVSASLEDSLRARGYRGPFEVVPNPVDTALFHPPLGVRAPGPPRVLAVLSLVAVKGPLTLIEAAAALPGVRVEIVGDGPLRPACESRIRELGLASTVTLLGTLPRAVVAERMRRADVVAVPSEWETFALVAAEAQASGVPVVASRIGALLERVAPDRGVLVEPGDPVALAAGLRAVLDAPGKYDPTAIAAAARTAFAPAAVADAWDAIYARLASG